ncbi:hypothetical protein H2199_004306 [Coniosporium tulheliwenetii]|uniref:Uncharacterized protein n=1 Tax=Coniosporium tulheliwenetii TaxID=3383036 RepID=A0ACC2Z8L0_9PEZI|nr:hypothetical protein H2199_004306 [Cladosporium sp. JES 115]
MALLSPGIAQGYKAIISEFGSVGGAFEAIVKWLFAIPVIAVTKLTRWLLDLPGQSAACFGLLSQNIKEESSSREAPEKPSDSALWRPHSGISWRYRPPKAESHKLKAITKRRSTRLEDLLCCYPIIASVATNLHYVDLLELSLVSRAVRAELVLEGDNGPSFKVFQKHTSSTAGYAGITPRSVQASLHGMLFHEETAGRSFQ